MLLPDNPQKYNPITPGEAKEYLSTGYWSEDPALKIVLQDLVKAENHENSKSFILGWSAANSLYQSPPIERYWEGTQVPKASVPFYTVNTAVNALVPQIVNGLFSDDPPFVIQERAGTSSEAARAVGDLLAYQLLDINFREEIRLGTLGCSLFGTQIWKWGWERYTRERKIYKRKTPKAVVTSPIPGMPDMPLDDDDEIIEEVVEEIVDRPVFEHKTDLRQTLVDPGLRVPDIRKAKYVIDRLYMTWDDLDKLRDRPGFNIPSREKLLELFLPPTEPVEAAVSETGTKNPLWDARAVARYEETTINPFEQPLEVLERWDNDTYIVVLQKKLVICNDKNPYGKIPFLSIGWSDVPDAFWSIGLGRTIGSEQRLQQGLVNTMLDQATLNLNGVYIRIKGKNIPTQNIRIAPGKIIDVEDKDGFRPLDRQPAVPEALEHLNLSQSRVETVSGASESGSMGVAGPSGHSNMARSATGAGILAAGAGNRVSDFIEKLANQVLVPFLYELYEMNRAMLAPSQLRYILNDELESEYFKEGGDLVDLFNANVKFAVLAGAKMQTRRNMAQALPLLTQNLFNPSAQQQLEIQGKKINIQEIIRMWFDSADFKNYNDVIVDMSPDDLQRMQQNQQGGKVAQQTQAQQALQDQKFQQQQILADQENTARAARDVLRESFKKAAEPEAITGEPGTQGFGSDV